MLILFAMFFCCRCQESSPDPHVCPNENLDFLLDLHMKDIEMFVAAVREEVEG